MPPVISKVEFLNSDIVYLHSFNKMDFQLIHPYYFVIIL